jgi:hypothetical protein
MTLPFLCPLANLQHNRKNHETNWVQTMPGKSWNTILRLYAPLQPWFDQSWKPGDFERID